MITSCIAIIFGFRFFGRGLHEISGEEMAIIAFFMLFLFVPCLWLVRYLKDDEIDSNRQDKLVEIHIALTIVLTVAGGVFSRMSVLVNKWIDEQPFIVAAYIALALSVFGVVIGKAIDFPVRGGGFCYDSRLAIEKAVGYGWEKDFVIHLPFISFRNVRFRLDMV